MEKFSVHVYILYMYARAAPMIKEDEVVHFGSIFSSVCDACVDSQSNNQRVMMV